MKVIHYFSGLTLLFFVGIHILNHLMILHSETLHISFMKTTRKIYRQPVVEGIVGLSVLLQVVTGIGLAIEKSNKLADIFDRIHIASGLYLALFLIVHVAAVAIGRYKLHVDTNLYYGAGVMNMWPHKLLFIPYYFLALLSFFFHVACIHKEKISHYISAASATMQSLIIMFLGLVITCLIIIKMSRLKGATHSDRGGLTFGITQK